MKLSNHQVAAVKRELGADPIDAASPATAELANVFGDHTFYLASDGLFIIEPVESSELDREPAQIIRVAAWVDERKQELQPVPPEATEQVLDLSPAPEGGDNAA